MWYHGATLGPHNYFCGVLDIAYVVYNKVVALATVCHEKVYYRVCSNQSMSLAVCEDTLCSVCSNSDHRQRLRLEV